jgi:hypothetical protein
LSLDCPGTKEKLIHAMPGWMQKMDLMLDTLNLLLSHLFPVEIWLPPCIWETQQSVQDSERTQDA